MKKSTKKICLIICAAAALLALILLIAGSGREEPAVTVDASDVTAAPSPTAMPTETPAGKAIPTVDRQAELAEAKKKNPNTAAWLYIPGAEVDDPVMQAEDNGYYMLLDENGAYSMWGCYYAHCENDLSARDKLDTNTTIFGHSASNCDVNGPKFTKLYRYMDADYVKANPYIYLSVDGEDLIFQITALFITDIEFDYIDPNPTGDKLTEFFQTVERKNWLDFDGVSFSEGDTILTLSTCCRKYDETNSGNQRLVVMAKLLPAGAEAQEFSVSLAADPEMP